MSYAEPYTTPFDIFGWEPETTYNTRPTNINNWLNVGKFVPPWPKKDPKVTHSVGAGVEPLYVTAKRKQILEGSMNNCEIQTGEFVGAIMGTVVDAGSDPYTHTMTAAQLLPSFAIQHGWEQSADNLVAEFLGILVNKAVFKASEDQEELILDTDIWATTAQDGGSSFETITKAITAPYVFKEGAFSSTALYAGAKAGVFGFELTVNNNLKRSHAGGSYQPYSIVSGRKEYELNLTVGLDDDTEWDAVIATDPDTVYDFTYLLTRGANDTCEFTGNAKFKGGPPDTESTDIRMSMELVPYTLQIEFEDSIAVYPFA